MDADSAQADFARQAPDELHSALWVGDRFGAGHRGGAFRDWPGRAGTRWGCLWQKGLNVGCIQGRSEAAPTTRSMVEKSAIDNNLCELVLKRSILHRMNSRFYRNLSSAKLVDGHISLISTAEFNEANPSDDIVELPRKAVGVALSPGPWRPWNYKNSMAGLKAPAPRP